jgi:1,4-dihydroxy-2-naphthoate octaprenyltransferase
VAGVGALAVIAKANDFLVVDYATVPVVTVFAATVFENAPTDVDGDFAAHRATVVILIDRP